MAKRVLIVATVVKTHIMQFHIPTIKMLKDMGWTVDVAAKNDYPDNEKCEIPYIDNYYDIDFNRNPISISMSNIKAYSRLRKIIKNGDYDVIHCNTPVGGLVGRLAAAGARKTGTKVFYTAHGFHFYKGAPIANWMLYYPIEWICSFCTDKLITITKEDYERARKCMHAKKTEYIPGIGVDIERFSCKGDKSTAEAVDLNGEDDTIVLLSVGELNKNKNHIIVLKAMSIIKDKKLRYFIAGNDLMDGYLKKQIDNLGLDSQVTLLGYRKDLPDVYKCADIYIHPSYREGMSVALMEAMASGLPVLCSDIRGNRELIDRDKGGMLFDPSDAQELATYIKDISADNEKRRQMGLYNQNKVRAYDVNGVVERIKEFYGSVQN